MTTTFTPPEWALLADAPLAAATAVALAEPGGAQREADAILTAWRAAGALFSEHELIQTLIYDLDPEKRENRDSARTSQPTQDAPTPDSIQDEAVDLCARAVQLLEQKTEPETVDAYQRFVLHIATQVAGAARSGGLFGVGGVSVTVNEQAVLRAIRFALGYMPPELTL
jgi:hypothetical protein